MQSYEDLLLKPVPVADQSDVSGGNVRRMGRAAWRSFRQLPGPWQTTVIILMCLVVAATGDGTSGTAEPISVTDDERLVQSETTAGDDAAETARLQSEAGQLREQLAMAEAELARLEASASESQTAAVRDLRRRLTRRFEVRQNALRMKVREARASAADARSTAKSLRSSLAAVSSAQEPVSAAPATTSGGAGCHPSYSGSCVPITSDVDCVGGSGDGPEYTGYVEVVGPDEYDLDSDGDGDACES